MLPYPKDIMRFIGIEPDELPFMISNFKPTITPETMRHWRSGRHAPRKSTFERHLKAFIEFVGSDTGVDFKYEKFWAVCTDESKSAFVCAWESVFLGWDLSCPSPELWTNEAKRLVEYTELLKFYFETKDPQGLANKLEHMDIPHTNVTREAIRRFRVSNNTSHESMEFLLAPIVCTNLLYLIACLVADNEVLNNLYPLYGDDGTVKKLPIARWLDGIRRNMGITSDTKLGDLVLPGQSPESAVRQIRRWRKGEELPSWQWVKTTSQHFPEEASQDLYWELAIIRVLHGLFDAAGEFENQNSWFNRRDVFETVPQLQELAKERAVKLSSDSGT